MMNENGGFDTLLRLDIPEKIKHKIESVATILLSKFPHNINKIILFGSYATGKYQPDSDIDIAVVLHELPDIKQRRIYKQAIDSDIGVDLLFCTGVQLASGAYVYKWVNEQGILL